MADYLAHKQTQGLGAPRTELNAMLEAVARQFGITWLNDPDGSNPVQRVWVSRDALATNELLNFADAVQKLEVVDPSWLKAQVSIIKGVDPGTRAGAIFEVLALGLLCSSGMTVQPCGSGHPGYDAVVEMPDQSSLLVSVKNHGMSASEIDFRRHAKEVDLIFTGWLAQHALTGELRILCRNCLSPSEWMHLKQDVQGMLAGHLDGSSRDAKCSGDWHIVVKPLSPEYSPLSQRVTSSIVFLCTRAHQNEQNNFVENLRKGCANLVKHSNSFPDEACRILFVRLGSNASTELCSEWARGYFSDFPNEKIGAILLYQACVVNAPNQTSLVHFVLPILGPQYAGWSKPHGKPARQLPNMTFLIGTILGQPSRRVIQSDETQISLEDAFLYQRGDVYRAYKLKNGLSFGLSNPAPGIKIHAEIEQNGQFGVMEMIASEQSELWLLP